MMRTYSYCLKELEYLVKWLNYGSFEATWEPKEHLTQQCLQWVYIHTEMPKLFFTIMCVLRSFFLFYFCKIFWRSEACKKHNSWWSWKIANSNLQVTQEPKTKKGSNSGVLGRCVQEVVWEQRKKAWQMEAPWGNALPTVILSWWFVSYAWPSWARNKNFFSHEGQALYFLVTQKLQYYIYWCFHRG